MSLDDDLRVLWRNALEAVSFVASGQPAVSYINDGEAFRSAHAKAVPPIPANRTPGYVRHTLPHDLFINVRVTLKNANHVVAFKQRKHLMSVGHREAGVLIRLSRRRHIGIKRCDQGDVSDDDYGRAGLDGAEVGDEPIDLSGIDAAFVGAIVCDRNRVKDYKVDAFVIKGIVSLTEVIFKHLLAIEGG